MNVTHDEAAGKFTADVNGQEAYILYTKPSGEMWEFTETHIPEGADEKAVTEALVGAALEAARATGVKVLPTSQTVQRHIVRNPDFQDLLA